MWNPNLCESKLKLEIREIFDKIYHFLNFWFATHFSRDKVWRKGLMLLYFKAWKNLQIFIRNEFIIKLIFFSQSFSFFVKTRMNLRRICYFYWRSYPSHYPSKMNLQSFFPFQLTSRILLIFTNFLRFFQAYPNTKINIIRIFYELFYSFKFNLQLRIFKFKKKYEFIE